jgi:hypothetical protein
MVETPLESPKPRFMKVDQRSSGSLEDCIVIGFPQFASDQSNGPAHREVHGRIAPTDGADSDYLLMRSDLAPATVSGAESAWAGLSGGLVFHQDRAIGVVAAHSTRDGTAVFQISGLPAPTAVPDARLRSLLGIVEPGSELSEVLRKLDVKGPAGLAEVRNITPYDLGAGNWRVGAEPDDYVPRHADAILDKYVRPGCFVLIRGWPKAGKTRTAYEALLRNSPNALVLAMDPSKVESVMTNPVISGLDCETVLWLDDAERFMRRDSDLTHALVSELQNRHGLMIVGTIRSDQAGNIERSDARSVFGMAQKVPLDYASNDPHEHAACGTTYPDVNLDQFSLPEQLVGAPAFAEIYEGSKHGDLPLRVVLETTIDWVKTGAARGISESQLMELAQEVARLRYQTEVAGAEMLAAIARACAPLKSENGSLLYGRMAALRPTGTANGEKVYWPLDYLVTTDREYIANGTVRDQGVSPLSDEDWFELGDPGQYDERRDVPTSLWMAAIDGASIADAFEIAMNARARSDGEVADLALRKAADVGSRKAMVLRAEELLAMAGQLEREAR